jgi:hypothetical protein
MEKGGIISRPFHFSALFTTPAESRCPSRQHDDASTSHELSLGAGIR